MICTADLSALTARVATAHAKGTGNVLTDLLGGNNVAGQPDALLAHLADGLGYRLLRMEDILNYAPDFGPLSFQESARRRCALAKRELHTILLIVDPFDTDLRAWAMNVLPASEPCMVSAATLEAWLTHCESQLSALESDSSPGGLGQDSSAAQSVDTRLEAVTLRGLDAEASPAIRLVNSVLYDGLKAGASDIHLESSPAGLAVKFRMDGVLTAIQRVDDMDLALQAISRIKVLAQLDISERRVPQDGRLQIAYAGRPIDVRVSIMPSIHGEDAVLRILDRQHLAETLAGLTLAKLGFDLESAAMIKRLCAQPHGMLLVTGPTGSGKTTTLYAAIAETHESRDKIITIEDPVEYQLPGVLQIPVNERKGLTFARGLRSILRHDPDKILVGEIRDAETAQIAVQSALTGHLVFTTVHANTAFDVVGRFEQFGIDAYTFASAINAVLAQRLVRRLCEQCKVPGALDGCADAIREMAQHGLPLNRCTPMNARGCEHCRGTGYSGRFALGELLVLTPGLRQLISRRASPQELQIEASGAGWTPLRRQALLAWAAGHTSWDEVQRVV